MAGKAKFKKTYGTKLKDQTTGIKQLYSLAGSTGSPRASTMSFGVAGGSSTPPEIDEYARLKTQGDSMIGAIAYYPKITVIDGSGEIDVVQGGVGALDDDYTSYLIVTPVGVADDLETINGVSHAGQLIHLEANSTGTITLKHNTGNIFIPSEADFTIEAGGFATLIYDIAIHANKWVLVSSSSLSGWSGSATSDLDMNTYDIIDVDRLQFTSDSGAGRDNAKVEIYANANTPEDAVFNHPASSKIRFTENGNQYLTFDEDSILPHVDSNSAGTTGVNIGSATKRPYAVNSRTINIYGGGAGIGSTLIGLNFSNNAGVSCGGVGGKFTSIWNGLEDLGTSSNYWKDLYIAEIQMKDTSADPTTNGQFTRNGNDVKVYTDGGVKNLSDIGSGGGGANTALSNLSSVSVNATIDMNNNNIEDASWVQTTQLTVGATGASIGGDTEITGDLNQNVSLSHDLGIDAKRWNNCYVNTLTCGEAGFSGEVVVQDDVRPNTNGTGSNLGSSSFYYQYAYLKLPTLGRFYTNAVSINGKMNFANNWSTDTSLPASPSGKIKININNDPSTDYYIYYYSS